MWILEFISVNIIHLMVLISSVGLLLLPQLHAIPFFVTYKTAAQYILMAALVFGVYTEGIITTNSVWEAKQSTQRLKDSQKETKAAEKTIEIVEKVVEKVKIVKEKQDALIIKVPVYIPQKVDAECPIPNSVVQLFDHSATNTVPDSSEEVRQGSSDVTMSEMQTTIINNNSLYYKLREEYQGLLEWSKEQKKIHDDTK